MSPERKRELNQKLILARPLLIFCVIYLIYFNILENSDFEHYYVPYSPLDTMIPFVPVFIIPYLLWFILVPAVAGILLFTDEEVYQKTSIMLMAGMTLFLLISTFFPTKLYLRPDISGEEDVFCRLVKMIYSKDTPTNVFPSIHVYNTCVVLGAVYESRSHILKRKNVQSAISILSVLIILATVFLKQHSIIDVLGAGILYAIIHYIADEYEYRNGKRLHAQSHTFNGHWRRIPTDLQSPVSYRPEASTGHMRGGRRNMRSERSKKLHPYYYEHTHFNSQKTAHPMDLTSAGGNQRRTDEDSERYRTML